MDAAKSNCMIVMLQCGRIYKDAEIRCGRPVNMLSISCFNVAASIKMRKYEKGKYLCGVLVALQCGRIYKDAEISNP